MASGWTRFIGVNDSTRRKHDSSYLAGLLGMWTSHTIARKVYSEGWLMAHSQQVEIQRNYATFLDMVGKLLAAHAGRYALFHDQQLAGVFDSPGEAARAGFAQFGHEPYSIQYVTDEPVDLGFMSNAIRAGANQG